ncbi:hypothetical protein EDC01DRAFT_729298 [Geopyxis carbonaria]|nr:hypothetical protein EDC01DRAFT_729298 [Geopyxis carbonaria]
MQPLQSPPQLTTTMSTLTHTLATSHTSLLSVTAQLAALHTQLHAERTLLQYPANAGFQTVPGSYHALAPHEQALVDRQREQLQMLDELLAHVEATRTAVGGCVTAVEKVRVDRGTEVEDASDAV